MYISKDLWEGYKTYLLIDAKEKHSEKPQAIYADKSRFNKLVKWFEGKEFSRVNFSAFMADMRGADGKKKYSNAYCNNLLKCAKSLGTYLKMDEIRDFTYFPEQKLKPFECLTKEEIENIAFAVMPYHRMANFQNQRNLALYMYFGMTGVRPGEAFDLRWSDVYDGERPHTLLRDTKTNDDRTVYITHEQYQRMMNLPHYSKQYVFSSYRGEKLTTQAIDPDLAHRVKAVGITKPVTLKLFRKSYVTTMLENDNVDWFTLSPLVGHKNPKTTLHYLEQSQKRNYSIALNHPLMSQDESYKDKLKRTKDFLDRLWFNSGHYYDPFTDKSGKMTVVIEE